MLFRMLFHVLDLKYYKTKAPLGRWGYHWEIKKNVQKYYD
jgi:hypothetical protein